MKNQRQLLTFIFVSTKIFRARKWMSAFTPFDQLKHKLSWLMINERLLAVLNNKMKEFEKVWGQWIRYLINDPVLYLTSIPSGDASKNACVFPSPYLSSPPLFLVSLFLFLLSFECSKYFAYAISFAKIERPLPSGGGKFLFHKRKANFEIH